MKDKIINKRVEAFWNMRGATYSKSWQSVAKKKLSNMETDFVEKAIKDKLNTSKKRMIKTLDIGIGIGRISTKILKYNVSHYGIDISKTMVKYCKDRFSKNKKVKKFQVHDILNPLPKDLGTFDVVSAIRVLSFSPKWERQLRHIYAALNKNGVLVFTFPNRYSTTFLAHLVHGNHLGAYEGSYEELKNGLEKIGFKDIKITGFSRLLDTIYDMCNSEFSTRMIFSTEKLLEMVFGKTLFARLFYITCRK